MVTLTKAASWNARADDLRCDSLSDLHAKAAAQRASSTVRSSSFDQVEFASNGRLYMTSKTTGKRYDFTHWSFGQACQRLGGQAEYLRSLPVALARDCMQHHLAGRDEKLQLLVQATDRDTTIRAFLGSRYTWLWNEDIATRLLELEAKGWEVARPTFEEGGKPAIYLGDRDMFAFMVWDKRRISIPGRKEGLARGFYIENSEVGGGSVALTTFLYDFICCNHLIWGATNIVEFRKRHIGDVSEVFERSSELKAYAEASSATEEQLLKAAQIHMLGDTKEEAIDWLYNNRRLGLQRKPIEVAYDLCEQYEDGNPCSVWGMVSGLTRYSQRMPYGDERNAIDVSAGRLLELAR